MDGLTFDTFTRSLTVAGTRRHALAGLLAGALGLLAAQAESAVAKKKKPCPPCKKRKKGKCKGSLPDGAACVGGACQGGRCVAALPPGPSGPTCYDGVRNGNETGVDCGGPDCSPCPSGQACSHRADCVSALCQGTCQQCSAGTPCGADVNGNCGCQAGTCFTAVGFPVSSCAAECPSSWPCNTVGGGGLRCYPPCGASETCGRADACNGNTTRCGHGGQCFQPLGGGLTRCGASTGEIGVGSCGCTSHQQCERDHGAGTFCATFNPNNFICTCGFGGPTTFCALPR
jgi:hypothetical protein